MAGAATTTGVAVAAGTITLTGSIVGVPYDALLAGFFGGLVWLTYRPPADLWKTASSVAVSSLIAGVIAPLVAAWAIDKFAWLSVLLDPLMATRIAAGVIIGLCAQVVIPAALNRLGSKVGEL